MKNILNKIKQVAEDKVKDLLREGKILLKFATASVIEAIRRNPELCNFVIYDNSNSVTISYGSKFSSLMLSEQEQPSNNTGDDIYISLILEEAEKMYNNLTTKLTNGIISAAAMRTSSSLLPSGNNNQKLSHKNDEIEEQRYNNQ